jgi:glycosyltransferase involved in cell wall biosynthesis
MRPTVSVVIASYNAGLFLGRALSSLSASTTSPLEVIVVDDCSTDASAAPSVIPTTTVIRTPANGGPARARNLGARSAQGEILFFMDSDVCVHPDTLERVYEAFERSNSLDAVIGAYDDTPGGRNFLSQYRNLMHCFVHRTGSREAFTFWSGCGAIRRDVFLQFGGFDESYERPSVEDIELGYRLVAAGRRIMLRPDIQVKHLKRWTLWQMIETDVFNRGIPWADLILRERRMPSDLNLQVSQRLSVVLVYVLIGLSAVGQFLYSGIIVLLVVIMLNLRFYSFLANRRGYHFAAAAIPFHLLYHFYNGLSFGIGLIRWGAVNGRP